MVGKSKPISKEHQRRFRLLQDVGCICCKKFGVYNNYVQIHHIVEGNKRLGHFHTLPLCYFHHEGIPPEGISREEMEKLVGPSLKSKKRFVSMFGTERELLEEVNSILEDLV